MLAWVFLLSGKFLELEREVMCSQDPIPQCPQRDQSFLPGNDFRIRNGVGRSSQQIRQADLRADRLRQNSERQIKGTADRFQQRIEFLYRLGSRDFLLRCTLGFGGSRQSPVRRLTFQVIFQGR